MSKESLLKKEFKESDLQRARNLVNKDFTSKTKSQTGYQKKYDFYEEGDIWEEKGSRIFGEQNFTNSSFHLCHSSSFCTRGSLALSPNNP